MTPRRRPAVLVLATALVLAGCAGAPGPGRRLPPATVAPSERAAAIEGRWTSESAGVDERPWIELQPDGTLTGYDGCNGFSGLAWAADGDRVVVEGEALRSLRGCSGIDQRLADVVSLRPEAGTLVAVAADGSTVGVLRSSEAVPQVPTG
ncbi:META domain-containing protein [Aeromicrobium sp. 50.2.37]|uniref:META domain-containing protein n=1 Tax=Aeromicrobium sp. 50.2.37 TaxID=2969305 RepID=UPI00214F7E63|nr:hypothetical protein [Aeromicrobium sp. 50.2.37]MCR4513432.1 hypothetical protein [Aeromicrobium sp. 50.2.37]